MSKDYLMKVGDIVLSKSGSDEILMFEIGNIEDTIFTAVEGSQVIFEQVTTEIGPSHTGVKWVYRPSNIMFAVDSTCSIPFKIFLEMYNEVDTV